MRNLNARNPLGIIALFISLIYGTSALLLGASVGRLSADSQERLVWFVVGFPIAVLLAFLYLVTRHHRKLYGPSDYRTDEGFLTAGDTIGLGRKYLEEARSASNDAADGTKDAPDLRHGDAAHGRGGVIGIEDGTEGKVERTGGDRGEAKEQVVAPRSVDAGPTAFAAYAYMIEGLVLQELQNEYRSPVRRDATLPTAGGRFARVDGILEGAAGPVIAEIKLVRRNGDIALRLQEGRSQLRHHITLARETLHPGTTGVLVLVLDGAFGAHQAERAARHAASMEEADVRVRVIEAKWLTDRYGFTTHSS